MVPILAVWLLGLQSDPAQDVARLASDRIEDRNAAEETLKDKGRAFRDAARLWTDALAEADPATRSRLDRIGRSWRQELHGDVTIETLPPEDPKPLPSELGEQDLKVALRLCTTRLTVTMVNASLPELMTGCRARSGIRIRTLGIQDPWQVILNLEVMEEPLDAILSRILKPRNLHTVIRDGILWIGPAESLYGRSRLQFYSVQDLTRDLPGDELLLQILRDVKPAAWIGDPDRWIEFQNDTLIVRNTAAVHRSLCGYLNQLRTTPPEDALKPPEASLATLFEELRGFGAEAAEQRLCALGRELAGVLRRLRGDEESPDLDQRLQAQQLSGFLRERLNEEPVRQVLEFWSP